MGHVRRTGLAVAIWAIVISAIAGCGSGGGDTATRTSSSPQAVDISDYTYKPATLTVPAGTKLTFVNHDSTAHTATSKQPGAFDTGPIQPGKSATVTLTKPGTFTYYCAFHPFMEGTIKVG
jgi:plastocyanin